VPGCNHQYNQHASAPAAAAAGALAEAAPIVLVLQDETTWPTNYHALSRPCFHQRAAAEQSKAMRVQVQLQLQWFHWRTDILLYCYLISFILGSLSAFYTTDLEQ
jgi:hypothetical protein